MNSDKRTPFVARNSLLKLLSDDEVASVSSAETFSMLAEGDEYIDLEQLDKGGRRAKGERTKLGRILPKKAIHEKTWNKIMAQLSPPPAAGAPASP